MFSRTRFAASKGLKRTNSFNSMTGSVEPSGYAPRTRKWQRGTQNSHGGASKGGSKGRSSGWDNERASHADDAILTFNGAHKFLSNFFWSQLVFEGLTYPSVEHAFQAAKLKSSSERKEWGFTDSNVSFGAAKRLGRQVPLREDWKDIREDVMAQCLEAKFVDPALRTKLIATGNVELIDGHSGSPDLIWGYHWPSEAGENRLGKLLMDLRTKLRTDGPDSQVTKLIPNPAAGSRQSAQVRALYHLDWPMKCLHDGLPTAYAERISSLARDCNIGGLLVLLPERKFCIALKGQENAINDWEHRMRTENVDVNSRGKPCKERMLVELHRASHAMNVASSESSFKKLEVWSWTDLIKEVAGGLGMADADASSALGPEPPELPKKIRYGPNRTCVYLDGQRFPLCLNEHDAPVVNDKLLGTFEAQQVRGAGVEVPLVGQPNSKPSIFGGRFARSLQGLLEPAECKALIDVAEGVGFGLAGTRGFNPFARFALRSLVDAPQVATVITNRLSALLPTEYPPRSGRPLVSVNERCRFLKYLPGMHHMGDHTDCTYQDPERGQSFLTVQIYLNEDFSGGHTTFISDRLVPIEPTVGGAVVFDHELYHRGGMVTKGVKYALRLDVLYGHPGSTSQEIHTFSPDAKCASGSVEKKRRSRWAK